MQMQQPRSIPGSRVPLFERLVDLEPNLRREAEPLRIFDLEGLRESIARNLAALLNTRTAPGALIEYGLPDLSGFYASHEADRAKLAETVARRIERYEPRLIAVKVVLRPDRLNPRSLQGEIKAILPVSNVREAVSFPFSVGPGVAEVSHAS